MTETLDNKENNEQMNNTNSKKITDMRVIEIEKVVINIGVGKSGDPIERAKWP
jgi:ribosomal protein L5